MEHRDQHSRRVRYPTPLVFYANPPYPFGDIEAADFDLDIGIVGAGLNALSIALNDGAGAFPSTFAMIQTNFSSLVGGDFTGDGKPDLIALNGTTLSLFSLYINSTP